MSDSTDKPAEITPVVEKLYEAQARSDAGQYRDALRIVREAKSLEARNIYILAFEKQVEQLAELSELKLLTEEQRIDIMESLPGIIERAAESSQTPAGPAPVSDTRAELNREREERAAALEWLKNQYFQHAHDYVRKGEYQHALAEIRRVYIIDPNNTIAKDFEKQIDQLISLRKVQATPKTQSAPSAYPGGGETHPRPEGARVQPPPAPPAEEPKPKRRISTTMIVAMVLTIIAIAIAIYYFRAREKMLRPPTPVQQDVGSLMLTQPSEAPEQRFIITQAEGGGTVSAQATLESGAPEGAPSAIGTDFAPPTKGASVPAARQTPPPPQSLDEQSSGPSGAASSENEGPVEEARIARLARPRLPDGVYASGLEGQVVVQVEIDKDGQPVQVRIVRSTNDLLNGAVIDAIKNSEFAPRKMSYGPVTSRLTIPFSFHTRH